MALAHSPKLVTNGLLFAYDMGPNPGVNKSWKGKPTTNLVSDTISQNGWSGSYSLIDSATKTFNVVISQGGGTGSAWRSHYWSVSSYIGSSVTISMDVEIISENNATFTHTNVGQGNTGSFPYHIAGSDAADRVRVESLPNKTHMTWSGTINSTGVVGISTWINQTAANGGVTLRISNVQIEANEFETPFVNGTRSNTQALLDWTGNNTITINGLTYNNDGTFDYYGTNGTGLVLPGTNFSLNEQTIECWCYASNFVQNGFMFEKTTNNLVNTQYSFFFNNSSTHLYYRTYGLTPRDLTRTTSTSGVINNQWNHMVATFDGSTKKIYVNGAQKVSAAVTGTITQNTTGSAYIGTYGNFAGYPYNGKIGSVKIYNRALTTEEININFNAHRGRYGI